MLIMINMSIVVVVLDLMQFYNVHGQILSGWGKNVVIFILDNSPSVHVDNEKKVLGEDPTQGLDNNTRAAEAKYFINFTESRKRFVLTLI